MIEDFGHRISGAAKDRWQDYRHRIRAVDDQMIWTSSLSDAFPEPAYKTLQSEGVDSWSLAFIRAIRDTVPRKPTKAASAVSWARTVIQLRSLCTQLLDGVTSREDLERTLSKSEESNKIISTRIAMYQAIGHDRSLKSFEIQAGLWKRFNNVEYNPRKFFCRIRDKKSGISVYGETTREAIRNLSTAISKKRAGPARKAMRFDVYSNKATGEVFIGRKMGSDIIKIEAFTTANEAAEYLKDNQEYLEERFEALSHNPEERRSVNTAREGIDRRAGRDITAKEFHTTFGFRGVQFGNYVEGKRRQKDLNNAYDALMDLAEVLDCDPSDLSLKGTLGLAFGARGRGGKGAAAAHYEPGHVVINLTKNNGAGSLAHEWFHGLDNHLGRRTGAAGLFGTELKQQSLSHLTYEDREEIGAFATLIRNLKKTGIGKRSAQLDRFRSSPYYTQPCEIGARCFEAWVISELDRRDIRNDYLANISSEEMYTTEARLLGHDDNRFPYPLKSEMKLVSDAFEVLFDPEGVMMRNLPGHLDARWETPVKPRQLHVSEGDAKVDTGTVDLAGTGTASGTERSTGEMSEPDHDLDDLEIDFSVGDPVF
ncbi:LPD5 domain-containing protein [Pseudosulfitobacter pseudonitzschiae]|uniref:LPD5 domain-containing protein n=1 Tax=Pseudosulfitobacter pseudonitzschiae TaxID=1402135 RepID=UPI003B7C739D